MSQTQVFPVVQPSEFQVNLTTASCPCTPSDCGCGTQGNSEASMESCKALNSVFTLYQTQEDPNRYLMEFDQVKPAGVKMIELLLADEGDEEQPKYVACVTVKFEDSEQPNASWIGVGFDDYRNIGPLRARTRSSLCCMPKSVSVYAPPEPDYCAPHRDWQDSHPDDLNDATFFPTAEVEVPEDGNEVPVRFMNGQLNLRVKDLHSGGFGVPWGQTRIYNNRLANNYDYGCGVNWMIHELPMLVIHERKLTDDNEQEWVNRAIAVVRGSRNALWFDENATVKVDEPNPQWSNEKRVEWGTLTSRFGQQHQLVHFADEGLFRLIAPNGHVWEFNDFEFRKEASGALDRKHANWTPGRLKRHLGPGRQETNLEYEQGTGLLKNIQRKTFLVQETSEQFTYEYVDEGENFGRIRSVTHTRTGHLDGNLNGNIQKVVYSYYGTCDEHGDPLTKGKPGDLRFAAVQIPDRDDNSVWKNLNIHYYTYAVEHANYETCSTPDEAPIWKVQQFPYQQGLLEKVYSPEEFRAVFNGSVPEHDSYADLLAVADLPSNEDWIETLEKQLDEGENDDFQHLEIKYDDERRVEDIANAGANRFNEYSLQYLEKTRDYVEITEPYNTVRYRCIVNRPDGAKTRFYSNLVGMPLGRKLSNDSNPSEGKHCEAWVYHPTTGNLLRALALNSVRDILEHADEDDNITLYQSGDGVLGMAPVPASTLFQGELETFSSIYVYGIWTSIGAPPADHEGAGGLVIAVNYFNSAPGQRLATFSHRRLFSDEDHYVSLYKYASTPLTVNFGLGAHAHTQSIPLIDTKFLPIDTVVGTERYTYEWNQANRPGTSADEDSPAVYKLATHLPAVPSSQNGDNTAGLITEYFNEYGYLFSSKDARNAEDVTTFDVSTGSLLSIRESVGTIGRNTSFKLDRFGRPIKSIGPKLQAVTDPSSSNTSEVDSVTWTIFKDIEGQTWTASGYQNGITDTLINPVQIDRVNRNDQLLDSLTSKVNSTGGLTGNESIPQASQWVGRTQWFFDEVFRLVEIKVYNDLQTGKHETTRITEYDSISRPRVTVDESMTERTREFNLRSQVTEIKIGLDTLPALPRKVQTQTYNALGLPQRAELFTDSDSESRYISNVYDWRGRLYKTYSGDDKVVVNNYGNRVVNTPLSVTHFEFGQEEIGHVERKLDLRGRVYRIQINGNTLPPDSNQNPAQAESTLIENLSYDQNNNLVLKQVGPAVNEELLLQQWLKYRSVYDDLNRPTKRWTERQVTTRSFPQGAPTTVVTTLQESFSEYENTDKPVNVTLKRYEHNTPNIVKSLVEQYFTWSDPIGRGVVTAAVGSNLQSSRPSTIPSRSDSTHVTEQIYNDRGELELIRTPDYTSGGRGEVKMSYDDAGRLRQRIEAHGSLHSRTTDYTFHSSGQVETISLTNAHTGSQTTTYVYGSIGNTSAELAHGSRLAEIVYPDQSRQKFAYNRQGDVIKMTDPNQSVHVYEYSPIGKLTSDTVETVGTGVDQRVRQIGIDYDDQGRPREFTSYSATSASFPAILNRISRAYDDFGNIKIDRQAHDSSLLLAFNQNYEASTEYGPRLESIHYPGSILYAVELFDAAPGNNRRKLELRYDETKHHLAMQLPSIIRHRLFDTFRTVDLAELRYSGSGDPVASIALLNDTALLRDDFHNLTLSENFKSDFGDYDNRDSMGRQETLRTRRITFNNSISVQLLTPFEVPFDYKFDRANNVRRKRRNTIEFQPHLDNSFKYDELNRLIKYERGAQFNADGSINLVDGYSEWDYDQCDNWKRTKIDDDQAVSEGFVQNQLGNWLDSNHNQVNETTVLPTQLVPQDPPIYDANGNMTRMPDPMDPRRNLICTYDAWNRMATVHRSPVPGAVNQNNEFVAEYWYDGLDRRIVKHTGGVFTHFYYDTSNRVIEERESNSASTPDLLVNRQYVWGHDGRIIYIDHGEHHVTGSNDQTILKAREYLAYDQLGSVGGILRTEYATNGRISSEKTRYYDYEAYGRPKLLQGSPFKTFVALGTGENEDDYLFAGYRFDRETGLYHTHRRQYNPWLGVWTRRDPAEYHDSPNLYQYGLSNPATNLDPTGGIVEGLWQGLAGASNWIPKMDYLTRLANDGLLNARNPNATATYGQHALEIRTNTQFLSSSTNLFGAHKAPHWRHSVNGKLHFIDRKAYLKSGGKIIGFDKIYSSAKVEAGEKRANFWKYSQSNPGIIRHFKDTILGTPSETVFDPNTKSRATAGYRRVKEFFRRVAVAGEYELLLTEDIPKSALRTRMQVIRHGVGVSAGRILLFYGLYVTGRNLNEASQQSVDQGSMKPLVAQAIREAGGWGAGALGGALGGAAVGALWGSAAGPVGIAVGAIIGGFIFGIAGATAADWAADHIHEN